jgi:hypothetical protein
VVTVRELVSEHNESNRRQLMPPMPRQAKTLWIRSRGNIIRNFSSIVFRGIAEDHDI